MRKLDFELVFEFDHYGLSKTLLEIGDIPFIPSKGDTIDFNNFPLDDMTNYERNTIKESLWEINRVTWIKSVYNIYKIYCLCKEIK